MTKQKAVETEPGWIVELGPNVNPHAVFMNEQRRLLCTQCKKPITGFPIVWQGGVQFACESCVKKYYAPPGAAIRYYSRKSVCEEIALRIRETQHYLGRISRKLKLIRVESGKAQK